MIKQAEIQWSDGAPVSTQFDDVYFSKASGVEETQYVFIKHNRLPDRWIETQPKTFTIAETGFGTGLNLLCAWQNWLAHSQPHQTLHFVSVEKFPLNKASLQQALAQWPQLSQYSEALIDVYPPLVPGWHRITLPCLSDTTGNVVLHLFFGDIHDWLDQMQGRVDVWFLDGFAPSKNPEMWSDHLFHSMARLSYHQTTVATFTAASLVRRGLSSAGFSLKKAKGFGRKREMLTAQYKETQGPTPPNWIQDKPWLAAPKVPHTANSHAIVIGAGISGCATAYSLAKRGWHVTVIEQSSELASGASGNAQGVLYAKLASDMNIQSEFYLAGYLYSLHLLKNVMPDKQDWNNCGVLQLAFSDKELKRQQQFCERFNFTDVLEWVDHKQASSIARTPLEQGGLHFKDGAWIHPKAWCESLLQHDNIQLVTQSRVLSLQQESTQWRVRVVNNNQEQTFTSDAVVVCSAFQAKQLTQLEYLPTQPIAGQVSKAANIESDLNVVLCGDSYVTPTHNNNLNFGATYRLKSRDTNVTQEDHEFNRNKLTQNFPALSQLLDSPLEGRTSVRCSTPDYFPIAGAVCDASAFKQAFSELKKNKNWQFYEPAPFLKGLYLNIGHGSRGLSSAPLCGEFIAAELNGEILPIQKSHKDMLNPNRFLVAQTIKGQ